MKILILGATGATGLLLVAQSLEQLHQVTVLVRNPSKLNANHKNLTIITGDIFDKNVLTKTLSGQDAVLSALGNGLSLKSHDLITKAVSILIPAMTETNVRRLIFLSALGVGETFVQANFFQKIIFRTFLRSIYADKTRAEKQIHSSSLDWTLVYPVVLTNTAGTGNYKAAEVLSMKGMPKISRADVADFMVKQLTDNTYLKKAPVLME
jgi:putative NADH-flavin reductase